jgi:hypothetical protein
MANCQRKRDDTVTLPLKGAEMIQKLQGAESKALQLLKFNLIAT